MVATNYSRSFAHASRVAASSLVATDQFAHAGSVFTIQIQCGDLLPRRLRIATDFESRAALAKTTVRLRAVPFIRCRRSRFFPDRSQLNCVAHEITLSNWMTVATVEGFFGCCRAARAVADFLGLPVATVEGFFGCCRGRRKISK